MAIGRAYWYTKATEEARCDDCDYVDGGPGVPGAMGRAARHHDATGHVITIDTTRTYVYGEDAPGKRRWWKA